MSDLILAIGGAPVRLGDQVSLTSLTVRYNQARELVFAAPRQYALPLNLPVLLTIDGVVRFRGKILTKSPDEALAGMDVYTCEDYVYEAFGVQVNKWRTGAAAAALGTYFGQANEVSLKTLLSTMGSVYGAELRAVGAAPESLETAVFTCSGDATIPMFSCTSGGVPDAMNAICEALPGSRWLWLPDTRQWLLVNVLNGVCQTISLPTSQIASLPIEVSIRDCYSKVTMLGNPTQWVQESCLELLPGWDAALESVWSMKDVTAGALAEASDNPLMDVYRLWSFAHLLETVEICRDFPIDLRQKIETLPGVYQWVSVRISEADIDNGLIRSWAPCVRTTPYWRNETDNARRAGKCKAPLGMALRYTTITSAEGATFSVGHSGQAYTEYGVTRELVLKDLDSAQVTAERVQLIHDAVSRVKVTGAVPVLGDVPSWLWGLACCLNVRADNCSQTHLENVDAIVSGFSHSFAGGGVTQIELSSDRSPFLGSAMP